MWSCPTQQEPRFQSSCRRSAVPHSLSIQAPARESPPTYVFGGSKLLILADGPTNSLCQASRGAKRLMITRLSLPHGEGSLAMAGKRDTGVQLEQDVDGDT